MYRAHSFDASVHFSPALDADTAARQPLLLTWRFPGANFRIVESGSTASRPIVEFNSWADESKVIHPEVRSLTSELLRALVQRIPELAFIAGYATSVVLTAEEVGSWTVAIPSNAANPEQVRETHE